MIETYYGSQQLITEKNTPKDVLQLTTKKYRTVSVVSSKNEMTGAYNTLVGNYLFKKLKAKRMIDGGKKS